MGSNLEWYELNKIYTKHFQDVIDYNQQILQLNKEISILKQKNKALEQEVKDINSIKQIIVRVDGKERALEVENIEHKMDYHLNIDNSRRTEHEVIVILRARWSE